MEKLLPFLQQQWFTVWGLVTGWIASVLVTGFFIPDQAMRARVITAAVLVAAVTILWWFTRQPPKTKKGMIGFALCLDAGSTPVSQDVRDHFIRTVQRLIHRGEMRGGLQVLVVPDHIANTIVDGAVAGRLRTKMKAHFLLFGNVRLGNFQGEPTHFVRMLGIVSHATLSDDIKGKFAEEFTELLPQNVNVSMANDLTGFEFVSSWMEVSAKYIVAVAASLSGVLAVAAGLFKDVVAEISALPSGFPAFDTIRDRAPRRLADINGVLATLAHRRWVSSKDPVDLKAFGDFVEAIPDALVESSGTLAMKAIWLFLGKHDVAGALKIVEDKKHEDDPAWHFSRAFLHAYDGDLKRANQDYLKAAKLGVPSEVLTQVDEFLYWVLAQEPDKVQVYFCLGVIAWRIRGDPILAKKEFTEFLEKCPATQFEKTRETVQDWLNQIESAAAV